jgi:predicted protein tyrosine phosphatase
MKTVKFYSAVDASKVSEPTNLISIGSAGDWWAVGCEHKDLLRVEFDDVEGFVGSNGFDVFTHVMAGKIQEFAKKHAEEDILVHCQAGMSRSAAVAKWISEKHGHELDLSPPCLGTDRHYNRHVYGTLRMKDADNMSAYYAELELADRLRMA